MLTDVALRAYQVEAVDRMLDRTRMLLGITMGGGKTLISIAAIEDLFSTGAVTRALVVVPSSLKYQWQEELRDHSTSSSLVIDGTPSQRAFLYSCAKYYRYTILNYEAVVNDWKIVRKLPFDCLVIDEASYIKSFRAKRSRAVKRLGRTVDHRFALTGQPVENRPEDLYSIMEFVDDELLGPFETFDRAFIRRDTYGRPKRYINLPRLHKIIAPAMVRKSREDIKDQLPDVIPAKVPITFSRPEAKLYNIVCDALVERMIELTDQFGGSFSLTAHYGRTEEANAMMQAQGEVMAMLLALRHICDDSRLLLESAMHYDSRPKDDRGKATDKGEGSQYAWKLYKAGRLATLPRSTKLVELRSRIAETLEADEASKIVVFSGFKGMLRYVREVTADLSASVLYNGDMNARQKDAAKRQFASDPETRLFLSSDAGGYGVNLKEANHLISCDLPWSTGKMEQREARIIRISTTFDHVVLTTMPVRGSVEDRMHDMLGEKGGVASAFVDGKYNVLGRYEVTLGSLTDFLQTHSV